MPERITDFRDVEVSIPRGRWDDLPEATTRFLLTYGDPVPDPPPGTVVLRIGVHHWDEFEATLPPEMRGGADFPGPARRGGDPRGDPPWAV